MTESRRSYRPPPSAEETSERQALVVRRGHAREDRDLFASRIEDSIAPPPSIRTGERGENSVLFSVDLLRKSASTPPPAPVFQFDGASRAAHDADATGTIDLKALAQATGGSLAYKPLTLSEPPMAAFAQDVGGASSDRRGSRTWMFAAGGAAAAVLLLGGIGLAASSGGESGKAAAAHVEVSRSATRDAAFAPVRTAPAAASADATSTTAAKATSGRAGKGGPAFASSYRPSGSSAGRSTPAPAKPAAAKPAADRCGCHGVLACVIRCSATGK